VKEPLSEAEIFNPEGYSAITALIDLAARQEARAFRDSLRRAGVIQSCNADSNIHKN